ncbi:MAG: BrxA family protein [Limisphaerales bacterium]
MTNAPHYTTNLSKAQGMVPETLELLELWEPGMSVGALKARVRAMGALGKATQVRVDDLVGRGFAQRYLTGDGKPAEWLRHLLLTRAPRGLLRQLTLIYTARANLILHDFIREVFWPKYSSRAGEVAKQDARDFIDRAVSRGALEKRWSDSMVERVTRYLLGTLVDFELIADNRFGHRQIRPMFIMPETVVFLAHELHFGGADDEEIVRHRDWGLFGLSPADVISSLEKAATQGHLFVQHSGSLLRVEWKHQTMEEMLDALAR